MSIGGMTGESKLTPPETAVPIDVVRSYSIKIAEMDLDIKAIYDRFKCDEKFTRQDVKDFIAVNKQNIQGLGALEDAILKKHGGLKARRIIADVYDEMIDKMANGDLLEFNVELSPEFEMQLIKQWAKATV